MISTAQLPSHGHPAQATTVGADDRNPLPTGLPATAAVQAYVPDFTPQPLGAQAIASTGGGQSHTNVMPFQCVCFIIALFGVFPSRN